MKPHDGSTNFDPEKCQGIIAPDGTPLVFQCNLPPAVRTEAGLFCPYHNPNKDKPHA